MTIKECRDQLVRTLPAPCPRSQHACEGDDELAKAGAGVLDQLATIPEEGIWLASHRSPETRRAYRNDVVDFMRLLHIQTAEELRQVDRTAVVLWRRHLEASRTHASSIQRKLAALSSLFAHLVERGLCRLNPVRDIPRPRLTRDHGVTPAFSAAQARALLDAPDPSTILGLRDRAILGVGFQAGARRASIVRLLVRDFFPDRGYDSLRFHAKGGREHVVSLHPETGERIRAYLDAAGHGEDRDGPLFRAVGKSRALDPKAVDRIVKRYARKTGIVGRYSAHSMRATFISTALDCGVSLEEVQYAAAHAHPSTTRLYDRREYRPARAAARLVSY